MAVIHLDNDFVDDFDPKRARLSGREYFDGFHAHSPEARSNEIPSYVTEPRVVNGRERERRIYGRSDNWKSTQFRTTRVNPLADRIHEEALCQLSDDRKLYVDGLRRQIEDGTRALKGRRLLDAQRYGLVA